MAKTKLTIPDLVNKKSEGTLLTWLTCYDYSTAQILEKTSLDMILVGDSGGMVALGYPDTSPVEMDEMVLLAKSVRRGAPNKFVVGDLPKGSYEGSDELAVASAMRFAKEAGCDAVKLEGSGAMASRVKAISSAGIPVFGHIGLTPQTAGNFGGYRVQGRSQSQSDHLLSQARTLEESGAVAILVEAVPPLTGERIASEIGVPILGIGAGPHVDGQLLILHDMLGLFPTFRPKFAKCFIPEVVEEYLSELRGAGDLVAYGRESRADGLARLAELAVTRFIEEVQSGEFPTEQYSYQ